MFLLYRGFITVLNMYCIIYILLVWLQKLIKNNILFHLVSAFIFQAELLLTTRGPQRFLQELLHEVRSECDVSS